MRRNGLAAVLMLAALFGAASNATAKDVKVGDTSIVLTHSPGFCELQEDQTFDRLMMSAKPKVLNVLATYWDCNHLDAARKLKQVAWHSAYYGAPYTRTMPPNIIPMSCAMRKKLGAAAMRAAEGFLKRGLPEEVTIDEVRDIGVVAEDDLTCYKANTHKTTAFGTTLLRLTVCAMTTIQRKLLIYCLDRPSTAGALAEMLADAKKDIAALHKANSE